MINWNNRMPVTNSIYDLIGMCRLSQLTENIFVRFANVVDDLALSVKSLIIIIRQQVLESSRLPAC